MITLRLLGGGDRSHGDKLENGVFMADLIKSMIIPRLLLLTWPQRGRVTRRHQRRYLLDRLKLAAVPFRLMKLPVDVRTRIWKFAIASQQRSIRYTITADSPFGDHGLQFLHPLTRVSREVRAETLAFAWSYVRLRFQAIIECSPLVHRRAI